MQDTNISMGWTWHIYEQTSDEINIQWTIKAEGRTLHMH